MGRTDRGPHRVCKGHFCLKRGLQAWQCGRSCCCNASVSCRAAASSCSWTYCTENMSRQSYLGAGACTPRSLHNRALCSTEACLSCPSSLCGNQAHLCSPCQLLCLLQLDVQAVVGACQDLQLLVCTGQIPACQQAPVNANRGMTARVKLLRGPSHLKRSVMHHRAYYRRSCTLMLASSLSHPHLFFSSSSAMCVPAAARLSSSSLCRSSVSCLQEEGFSNLISTCYRLIGDARTSISCLQNCAASVHAHGRNRTACRKQMTLSACNKALGAPCMLSQ